MKEKAKHGEGKSERQIIGQNYWVEKELWTEASDERMLIIFSSKNGFWRLKVFGTFNKRKTAQE